MVGSSGQLTIEFILLLVIVLTIVSTVVIPIINDSRDMLSEASMAATLSAASQKISETARAISYSGCGSAKTIEIYVTQDVFMNPTISQDGIAQFTMFDGETKTIKSTPLPSGIALSITGPVDGIYTVRVARVCD